MLSSHQSGPFQLKLDFKWSYLHFICDNLAGFKLQVTVSAVEKCESGHP